MLTETSSYQPQEVLGCQSVYKCIWMSGWIGFFSDKKQGSSAQVLLSCITDSQTWIFGFERDPCSTVLPMPAIEAYLNRGEESPLISDLYLGGGIAELSLLIRTLQCGNGEVIR